VQQYPPPWTPPPTPPRRHTGLVAAAVVAALVIVGAAVGLGIGLRGHAAASSSSASPTSAGRNAASAINVHGTLLLTDSPGVENLDDVTCAGMGGYGDIAMGAQVVITDESGTTVAVTELGVGKLIGSGATRECQFEFSASSVPAGKSFYGISVTHRGTIQYTEDQLRNGVELTLGD
jgi:hypothetical protein